MLKSSCEYSNYFKYPNGGCYFKFNTQFGRPSKDICCNEDGPCRYHNPKFTNEVDLEYAYLRRKEVLRNLNFAEVGLESLKKDFEEADKVYAKAALNFNPTQVAQILD